MLSTNKIYNICMLLISFYKSRLYIVRTRGVIPVIFKKRFEVLYSTNIQEKVRLQ